MPRAVFPLLTPGHSLHDLCERVKGMASVQLPKKWLRFGSIIAWLVLFAASIFLLQRYKERHQLYDSQRAMSPADLAAMMGSFLAVACKSLFHRSSVGSLVLRSDLFGFFGVQYV